MQSFLRLTIDIDDDGTCELFATASANGFSGHGSAWFNLSQIKDLSKLLCNTYPLKSTDCFELKGGNWSAEQKNTLTQLHLGLSFYPVGHRGSVGCQVVLATELVHDERKNSQHHASLEFLTSYDAIRAFSIELSDLANGKCKEAILYAVDI